MRSKITDVDIVQAGSGPIVILVHSSVAGARQWRRLMSDQEDPFHLIAVNLFGYVSTPAWSAHLSQTLEGQARLVKAVVPEHKGKFSLIGHSFGGSVAMKAAAKFGSRIDNLILLDLNSMAKEKHSPRAWGYAIALRNADMPMNGLKQRRSSMTIGAVQSHDTGILFIPHVLRVAAQVCGRVAVVQHGEVVESGTTEVLFASLKHSYTKSLLDAVPGKTWQQASNQ